MKLGATAATLLLACLGCGRDRAVPSTPSVSNRTASSAATPSSPAAAEDLFADAPETEGSGNALAEDSSFEGLTKRIDEILGPVEKRTSRAVRSSP